MTDFEANKLVIMLTYNFAGFMPADLQGAAVKKGMWLEELKKYDFKRGEAAVRSIIQTLHYPPQIADFREALGPKRETQKALTGPVYGTKEGNEAMYTADPEHVDRVFRDLMRDLA